MKRKLKMLFFKLIRTVLPGLMVFHHFFYQSCWEIIKDDLCQAVQEFFQGVAQPKGFTSTSIILIPKKYGAVHWRDFSLCNISLKILSKILANHINVVLSLPVEPYQMRIIVAAPLLPKANQRVGGSSAQLSLGLTHSSN